LEAKWVVPLSLDEFVEAVLPTLEALTGTDRSELFSAVETASPQFRAVAAIAAYLDLNCETDSLYRAIRRAISKPLISN
jgi:hypothetical protein